jgi:hypothetical protein
VPSISRATSTTDPAGVEPAPVAGGACGLGDEAVQAANAKSAASSPGITIGVLAIPSLAQQPFPTSNRFKVLPLKVLLACYTYPAISAEFAGCCSSGKLNAN